MVFMTFYRLNNYEAKHNKSNLSYGTLSLPSLPFLPPAVQKPQVRNFNYRLACRHRPREAGNYQLLASTERKKPYHAPRVEGDNFKAPRFLKVLS